jgi:lysozyme
MQISESGLGLIAKFEGLRLSAYPDPGTGDEPWTIGYGTTIYPNGHKVRKGHVVTRAEALEYLQHDTKKFADSVNRLVKVPLNQNQFDALVSFTYNIGEGALQRSTLLRKLNSGDYRSAANEFGKWVNAGGKELDGLVIRRAAERDLFLKAEPAPTPAPTPEPIPVVEEYFPWVPPPEPQPIKKPMAPILAALLPSLVGLIPELAKIFGSGPKTERNLEVAQKVADIVVRATNTPNLQGAVELMQIDPQILSAAKKAVQESWFELAEAGGGGIEGARGYNLKFAEAGVPFWKMPAFWITVLLLPLLYGTVYLVLTGAADAFSGELRAAIASSVVTGVLGGAIGFWLGSSFTTSKSRGLGAEPTN